MKRNGQIIFFRRTIVLRNYFACVTVQRKNIMNIAEKEIQKTYYYCNVAYSVKVIMDPSICSTNINSFKIYFHLIASRIFYSSNFFISYLRFWQNRRRFGSFWRIFRLLFSWRFSAATRPRQFCP